MKFTCVNDTLKTPKKWEGDITFISGNKANFEMKILVKGYEYHIIFGSHSHGNYVCVPNWDIGSEMSKCSDLFWNTERLSQYSKLKKMDAITIATALKAAGIYFETLRDIKENNSETRGLQYV